MLLGHSNAAVDAERMEALGAKSLSFLSILLA
jgi:hypothetical protein